MKEHKKLGQKQMSKETLHFVWGYYRKNKLWGRCHVHSRGGGGDIFLTCPTPWTQPQADSPGAKSPLRSNYKKGCYQGVQYGSSVKKVFQPRMFFNRLCPKVSDQPRIFCSASIWSTMAASKSEPLKSTLLNQSSSNKKSLWICHSNFS